MRPDPCQDNTFRHDFHPQGSQKSQNIYLLTRYAREGDNAVAVVSTAGKMPWRWHSSGDLRHGSGIDQDSYATAVALIGKQPGARDQVIGHIFTPSTLPYGPTAVGYSAPTSA